MSFAPSTRRFHALFLSLALAGAFLLVLNRTRSVAGDVDPSAASLVAVDEAWSKAAQSKDAKKVAAYYAEDGIAYPPNMPLASGRAAAEKLWGGFFTMEGFVSISWKTLHAEVSKSGELGFTAGSYELTVKGPDGKPGVEKGKYLCNWRKQKDGSWKATHDMWNADAK